jgi:hypothetical protein
MKPFKKYSLNIVAQKIPIIIREQIEQMKIKDNSIIYEYSISKIPSSDGYFLTDYQQNHVVYCYNNEIYDSMAGVFVDGKKIYNKWQKSKNKCILYLFIISELRKNHSTKQIIGILSDKNFDEMSLKIYNYLFC